MGNNLKGLWDFLKEMSRIDNGSLVTTSSITCLIKVLGEEGSYCKLSMQTGCRKAIRRRLYEANHLFREMLFKGFVPDVVTYNCLIDGCCKTNRIERALELFEDMNKRNCVPNRITYNSFIRYYCAVNEIDKGIEMMRRMQRMNHGVATNSSYTPIIHALCEAERVLEAEGFLFELIRGGSIPREYTYKLVCDALNLVGAANLIDDEMHKRIRDGIGSRCRQQGWWRKFSNQGKLFILNHVKQSRQEVGRLLGHSGGATITAVGVNSGTTAGRACGADSNNSKGGCSGGSGGGYH
ncbi:hypothetical protein F383_01567 [Gossypium arboreum]|uniref:Pentatricopeptide repeat-containing protein n=1 Tax=Gossypium arboreum TaxID=29729 RepID=A0A0B0N2K7_GOSAR|nr:hypothetical protein F383_01567 [Gossypium arboreum]